MSNDASEDSTSHNTSHNNSQNIEINDISESIDASETIIAHSQPGSLSQAITTSSTSSLRREFDKIQASYTSLPESEMSENMHETQGRIILKNGKKVRPKEHVVMEFFEMCSDLIQALTCPK